ncbi:carboxypeptidase-like regulatory domain-containing protein [Longimicrobium sp.]|uniref:carboxypeptidase-like regulatory domain-containing protein n=1 Tax=Longimicrobium sp. TaxID=2029185 RepID=UPI002E3535EC|nr:carboxypeptidase-like regulatory domain-containing protein [Longimicrobium sp.]HEX6040798.1 carboxypeptidase-like regulatory domain-containing protein [Longimicrobium sp.]
MISSGKTSLWAALIALLLSGAIHAQDPGPAIRGRVVDRGTGEPIASVAIRVTDADGAVATGQSNQAGLFSIRLPGAGTWTVAAERIGYADFTSPPVDVAPGAVLEVQVRMAPATLALDSVDVRVRRTPPFRDARARQFYDRMERAGGRFITPEQIAERRGMRSADMLRHVPGMDVRGDENLIMGSTPRTRCRPTIYINGVARILYGSVDDYVDRSRLWGVEVYREPYDAPPGFPPVHNNRCGVIVIWTLDS